MQLHSAASVRCHKLYDKERILVDAITQSLMNSGSETRRLRGAEFEKFNGTNYISYRTGRKAYYSRTRGGAAPLRHAIALVLGILKIWGLRSLL